MTHKHPKLNTYLFSDIKVVRSFLVAQQVKDPVFRLLQITAVARVPGRGTSECHKCRKDIPVLLRSLKDCSR